MSTTTESAVLVGAGDIASCSTTRDEATAALLDNIPGTVFTAGDNAYMTGSAAEYTNCYGPTWGRHLDRTRPAPGERDYSTSGAAGYFGYFGEAAGPAGQGYYSYDEGDWHVVVLNSSISMSAGSAQERWLRDDLAASPQLCTVAIWHQPRFSSTSTPVRSAIKPLWDDLYRAGVEVVVNAHHRFYERFAPQTPDGVPDPTYGVREFIVGTGGAGSTAFGPVQATSEVRQSSAFGVLKLTLNSDGYEWAFVPIAGWTFTDAGAGTCHSAPPPVANPGGPYVSEATVQFNGRASSDPQGDTPLSYAWDFGDGATDAGASPSHTYAVEGVYTVTLVVTDTKGNTSAPATTTATIVNIPPTVRAGPDVRTYAAKDVIRSIQFTDAGNGPWEYTVAWGDGSEESGTTDSKVDPFVVIHSYAAVGSYTVHVTVTDEKQGSGVDEFAVVVTEPGGDEIVLTAGDIAVCNLNKDEATANLLDAIAGTVLTLGDNAYPDGTALDYANCYDPSWGRHRDRTYAALGDNEYNKDPNATAAFDYFAAGVGPRGKGYYSIDLGEWHIIVVNDNVPFVNGSTQDAWLQADLAANTKQCTLAIWQQPLFYSSGSGLRTSRKILWQRLYAAGAEIVLNGNQHYYSRFAPQTPAGDPDPERGIREFVVGTGGASATTPSLVTRNNEVRAKVYGVLRLTLSPGGYAWEFVPIAGTSFSDSGSGTCH